MGLHCPWPFHQQPQSLASKEFASTLIWVPHGEGTFLLSGVSLGEASWLRRLAVRFLSWPLPVPLLILLRYDPIEICLRGRPRLASSGVCKGSFTLSPRFPEFVFAVLAGSRESWPGHRHILYDYLAGHSSIRGSWHHPVMVAPNTHLPGASRALQV